MDQMGEARSAEISLARVAEHERSGWANHMATVMAENGKLSAANEFYVGRLRDADAEMQRQQDQIRQLVDINESQGQQIAALSQQVDALAETADLDEDEDEPPLSSLPE